MFSINSWAAAFLSVSKENAESSFLYMKAVVPQLKSIPGVFFWYNDASFKIEKLLREAGGECEGAEYAIRFLCLLAKKKRFKYIDSLLERIEQILDERKGILNITLETASSLSNNSYEKELTQMIKDKTGAAEVKMKTYIRPELLGGYVLRTGSSYIDVSLKGQVKKMKTELEAAVSNGGKNVKL